MILKKFREVSIYEEMLTALCDAVRNGSGDAGFFCGYVGEWRT